MTKICIITTFTFLSFVQLLIHDKDLVCCIISIYFLLFLSMRSVRIKLCCTVSTTSVHGGPISLKGPHYSSALGTPGGPHIASGLGPRGPIPLVIWGHGVPKTGGPYIAATPGHSYYN